MEKKLRAGNIVGIALLCIGMAMVAFAAYRNMRADTGAIDAETVAAEVATQTGTRPLAAAAGWSPASRPGNRSAAMLPSLDTDAALALVEQGFQSVVLPDPFELFSPQEVAKAAEVLDALKEQNVFRTLTLTPVEEANLTAFGHALNQLIADSSFDALLISDISGTHPDGTLTTLFAGTLVQVLDEAELKLPVIFDIGTPGKELTSYQEAMASRGDELPVAEILVHCGAAGAQTLRAFINQFDEDTPVSALFDLKTGIPNGTLQETVQFLSALQSFDGIPLILQSAGYTPKNPEAAKLLQKFCAGALDLINASKGLSLSKPVKNLKAEQSVYTDKPTVNFTGASNPLFALTCNGKEVQRNESGDFSMDMPLKAGKNAFKFEHQDKTYIIDVYYNVTVLESVTPKGGIETTGGIEMVVGAVARRGATVTAALGPQTITLQPGSAGGEDGINADSERDSEFIGYVGAFKLKASGSQKEVQGTLIFTATYQGLSEKKNGALVTLLPATADFTPPPETAQPTTASAGSSTTTTTTVPGGSDGTIPDGTPDDETTATTIPGDEPTTTTTTTEASTAKPGPLLTPYSNNGLGTAQMVEITEGFANARWSGTSDTKFNPTASPLLAGSFDYVSGMQTIDGATYYLLGSGKRIKSTDLKVIASGYKLPLNKLRASSSTGGSLTMRFGVDWKIPFNVDLIGQNYTASEGFNGNVYGVSSYNATGLAITFYHTTSYSGSVSIGSFPLLASAEWSRDAAKNTVTLRLMFKNAGKFYGWQAFFDGGELVIRLRPKPPSSLSGAVIWLDAGHGGSDPGAPLVASHATLKHEKHVNILLANKIRDKLVAAGATVYMTRTGDTYVSPQERVRQTRQRNPDMFISIHCDSHETATPSGTSAFYYRAFGKPLAKAVHDRIVQAYRNSIYVSGNGIPNYIEMRDKVNRQARFYPFEVTRIEECPAILIEYGYGSNLTECRVLQNDTYQNLLAQATVDGIKDYLAAQ